MQKHLIFLIFMICLLIHLPAQAQKYVADTLIININKLNKLENIGKLTVTDKRNTTPEFISVYEKKKWLFFPVDQIVQASKPLAENFDVTENNPGEDFYHLDLRDFYIDLNESMFNRTLGLHGALQLSKVKTTGDTTLLGMFYYENSSRYSKRLPIDSTFTDFLSRFNYDFSVDFSAVKSDTNKQSQPGSHHFRKGTSMAKKNLYLSASAYYGYTFWGVDAELWFSSPEPSQRFNRSIRMLRYLNYGNRQSVALSGGVSQWNYRVNSTWLFQNNAAFLLGFNKWNDIREK